MPLMSIGEFSKIVNISPATLRRMHKTGELVPARISKGGTRYYSEQQKDELIGNNTSEKINQMFIDDIITDKKTWSYTSYIDVFGRLMMFAESHICPINSFIELLDKPKITSNDIEFIKSHSIDALVFGSMSYNWEQLSALANLAINTMGPDLSIEFQRFHDKYEIISAFATIEKRINHAYEIISNEISDPEHEIFNISKKCKWEHVKNFFDNETAYRKKIEILKKTLPEKVTARYLDNFTDDIYKRITGECFDKQLLKEIMDQKENKKQRSQISKTIY